MTIPLLQPGQPTPTTPTPNTKLLERIKAACLSGGAGVLMTPWDTFKNRWLAQRIGTQLSFWQQLQSVIKTDQLRGLSPWKKLQTSYAGASIYGPQKFANSMIVPVTAMTVAGQLKEKGTSPSIAGAAGGFSAAMIEALLNQPVEVVKVGKQLSPPGTTLTEVIRAANAKGLSGWTAGFGGTMVRNGMGATCTWATFITLRDRAKANNDGKDSVLGDVGASTAAAFARIAVSQPGERMKVIQQSGQTIPWKTLLFSRELWTGFNGRLLLSGSKFMVTQSAFALGLSYFSKEDKSADEPRASARHP